MEGKTQETAAAKAGMSVRSARKWQSGPLPSETRQERTWRTRPDPFAVGNGAAGRETQAFLKRARRRWTVGAWPGVRYRLGHSRGGKPNAG